MNQRPKLWRTQYRNILNEIMKHGAVSTNQRTKTQVRTMRGDAHFKIDLDGEIPVLGNRRYFAKSAAVETAWQLMGTKDPEFMLKHAARLWEKFVEDGELKAAYGYRWREAFGRDQLMLGLKALYDDFTNRQIYISAWDPRCDGLGQPNQPKNIPCPVGFGLNVSDNELHCSVVIRSSDTFVGLPYDVMNYALLTDAFASTLQLRPGCLGGILMNAHVYEPHFDAVDNTLMRNGAGWIGNCQPDLPGWTVDEILANPEGYVEEVRDSQTKVKVHPWNPMPEVVL